MRRSYVRSIAGRRQVVMNIDTMRRLFRCLCCAQAPGNQQLCAHRCCAGEEFAPAEIREAIRFHIEGLKQDGLQVPTPSSIAEYIDA